MGDSMDFHPDDLPQFPNFDPSENDNSPTLHSSTKICLHSSVESQDGILYESDDSASSPSAQVKGLGMRLAQVYCDQVS